MFPLGDDNTGRRIVPLVNWLLIAANVFVFVFLQRFGTNERFTLAYATVPYEILTGRDVAERIPIRDEYGRTRGAIDLQPTPIPVFLTLLTSMFLHGGLAHLGGNMGIMRPRCSYAALDRHPSYYSVLHRTQRPVASGPTRYSQVPQRPSPFRSCHTSGMTTVQSGIGSSRSRATRNRLSAPTTASILLRPRIASRDGPFVCADRWIRPRT